MRDVSIEYAHIYTNSVIKKEHEASIELLGKLKKSLARKGKSFSLVVLIDDYSFPDSSFNYDTFLHWLSGKGFPPDFVIRESQLIPLCDIVLSEIKDAKLKTQLVEYVKSKKYPCSLFIAAWYLLRLGCLNYLGFNKELCAKKIINILPESFKPFEDKALQIIASTLFAEFEKQIDYIYVKGRLLED